MTVLRGELLPAARPSATTTAGAVDGLEALLREWLIGYQSANTRAAYRRDMAHWLGFLAASGVDPLTEARQGAHPRLAARPGGCGCGSGDRARRLAAVSAFYTWMVAEDHTDRVRFPR
ncbi:site-specific integrase [Streptomyces rochei]|uniref:site-specific integrase n=1 Tax=Streptomyces rochei TaxID=1928 RepID=UPI0037AF68D6